MVDHYVLRARFSRFVMSSETASYTASSSPFVSRKARNKVLSGAISIAMVSWWSPL